MTEPDPSTHFTHQSVMLNEVVQVLSDVPTGVVVDATLGGGGHSEALLMSNERLSVVGLDRDYEAIETATKRLSPYRNRFTATQRRFDEINEALGELGHTEVSAVLFDLGVSSPQLDSARRGFSFRQSGPLDMRMDPSQGLTAADIINSYDQNALATLLRRNGDEPQAKRIAKAIVAARPITSTAVLAELIADALPAPVRRKRGHPARRSFQAIRIEVNQELAILRPALDTALSLLAPQGRCAVISYHSGEDRIVKQCFRDAANESTPLRPGLLVDPQQRASVRLLWRGARRPDYDEINRNPRSKAARMRAIEKLTTDS